MSADVAGILFRATSRDLHPEFFSSNHRRGSGMPREIARYRALEKIESLTLRDRRPHTVYAGDEFFFDGKPGPSLLPLNGAARLAKLKAIAAGPNPKAPVDTPRLARSVGFTGYGADEAQDFIKSFIARETSRQTAAPSTRGK